MKKMRLFLVCLLALSASADNFFLPAAPKKENVAADAKLPQEKPEAVPSTPLPPIEPIFSKNNDRVMAVQKVEFWVQMGAFQHQEGAKALETKLKAHGLNAKVYSTDLHRVVVGPYASREQAGRSLNTLRSIEKEAFLTTPDRLTR